MKIITRTIQVVPFLALCALMVLAPQSASAATSKALSCSLVVTTSAGTVTLDKNDNDTVLLKSGESVTIAWESANAKTATNRYRKDIDLSGVATTSPTRNTTYTYQFRDGSKRVTCDVKVQVVKATIESDATIKTNTRPTISGEAAGTKSVQVVITKAGASKPVFTSKTILVKKGEWSVKTTKALTTGVYTVTLLGEKSDLLNQIATQTLTVGTVTPSAANTASTLVVQTVPLLVGGTAKGNQSVPVSYLQLINIGTLPLAVQSVTLMQNGSAPVSALVALTANDDLGIPRGAAGGGAGPLKFDGLSTTIPVMLTLLPGEMRLLTVKAQFAPALAALLGTQLKLDVVEVKSTAALRSTFPLRGTTWTIGG